MGEAGGASSLSPFFSPRAPSLLQRSESRLARPAARRYPAERLTPLEALRGFTTSAAYASFAEHRVGVLSPGALADFIVVQGDPLDAPAEGAPGREEWETRLREMKVRSTVVGGRVMHGGF